MSKYAEEIAQLEALIAEIGNDENQEQASTDISFILEENDLEAFPGELPTLSTEISRISQLNQLVRANKTKPPALQRNDSAVFSIADTSIQGGDESTGSGQLVMANKTNRPPLKRYYSATSTAGFSIAGTSVMGGNESIGIDNVTYSKVFWKTKQTELKKILSKIAKPRSLEILNLEARFYWQWLSVMPSGDRSDIHVECKKVYDRLQVALSKESVGIAEVAPIANKWLNFSYKVVPEIAASAEDKSIAQAIIILLKNYFEGFSKRQFEPVELLLRAMSHYYLWPDTNALLLNLVELFKTCSDTEDYNTQLNKHLSALTVQDLRILQKIVHDKEIMSLGNALYGVACVCKSQSQAVPSKATALWQSYEKEARWHWLNQSQNIQTDGWESKVKKDFGVQALKLNQVIQIFQLQVDEQLLSRSSNYVQKYEPVLGGKACEWPKDNKNVPKDLVLEAKTQETASILLAQLRAPRTSLSMPKVQYQNEVFTKILKSVSTNWFNPNNFVSTLSKFKEGELTQSLMNASQEQMGKLIKAYQNPDVQSLVFIMKGLHGKQTTEFRKDVESWLGVSSSMLDQVVSWMEAMVPAIIELETHLNLVCIKNNLPQMLEPTYNVSSWQKEAGTFKNSAFFKQAVNAIHFSSVKTNLFEKAYQFLYPLQEKPTWSSRTVASTPDTAIGREPFSSKVIGDDATDISSIEGSGSLLNWLDDSDDELEHHM